MTDGSKHRGRLAALALALVGCSEPFTATMDGIEDSSVSQSALVSTDAWRELAAADDPLASHRPARVSCPSAAFRIESGGLEVQTDVCNYFSVEQPLLAELEPGSVVRLQLWHEALDASEPATAHVAWLLDDRVAGEAVVAIPGDAALLELDTVVTELQPAGSRVSLHLHNHGYNSWTFVGLSRLAM